MHTDIDIVIVGGGGNGSALLKEKAQYSGSTENNLEGSTRRHDQDLIKYWFRAVEKFTPWVHNVFFITDGAPPDFLDPTAEKLKIVTHRDFLPAEYLPAYYSHVIEMNLHRIPELSEQFILFNDDCFILRPMAPDKFFQNDLPCAYYAEIPLAPRREYDAECHMILNDVGLVNKHIRKLRALRGNRRKYYSPRIRIIDRIGTFFMEKLSPKMFSDFKHFYGPNAYLKSTFDTLWQVEPEWLDSSSRSHFDSKVTLTQRAAMYWQFAKGTFTPQKTDNVCFDITQKNRKRICRTIRRHSHDTIRLTGVWAGENADDYTSEIQGAFEKILSEKSCFEK